MIPPIEKNSAMHVQIPAPLPSIASAGKDSLDAIRSSLAHLTDKERTNWANSRNERGMTPLAIAIEAHTPQTNKMDVIFFLVAECNANPNIGDNDNWTPLYRASTGTRLDALEFLLTHRAEPNITNKDGSTPLHRLVDRGSEADVLALLSHGADVNAVNCFGTPLAYAAKNGNIAIAKTLLNAAADPNLTNDPLTATPAELASNNRKEEMKSFLLSRNGQLEVPISSKVHTSLSRLVYENDEKAILQSFMNGEKDEYGRSAAHYCAHLGKTDLLKKMCGTGMVDAPDTKGRTPLHYAVIKGHEQVVALLINDEGNCALDSKDLQGYCPLIWACQYNKISIAKLILERAEEKNQLSSILDLSDNFGWKAIHKSSQVGNLELVRMLVEDYKVDHAQLTSNNRSPLDLAQVTNAVEVVDYLNNLIQSIKSFERKF